MLTLLVAFTLMDFAAPGFFKTHDGEYHIVRLMYFDNELKGGQFPVRFARQMMYGYGSPLFTYFYPQIYYFGSLIRSFVPIYTESLKLVAVLASLLSIVLMFEWLSRHFSKFASFVGAFLFLFVPYRFVITYVTGAHQMLLSLMWLPLLLLSIFEVRRKKIWLVPEAIAMAGLITAHNVSALIFFPLVLLYIFVLDYDRKSGESWITPMLGIVWGLLLSASFLLPALWESQYVYLGKRIAVSYQDHWPTLSQLVYSKWGYGYSDSGGRAGLSFQVGLAQWLVVGLTAVVTLLSLVNLKKRADESGKLLWLCWFLLSASFFMMLPVSDFIWKVFPLVQQIQFPWRILILVMVVISVMGAYLSERLPRILMILILIFAIFANRNYLRSWERLRYTDVNYINNSALFNGPTDIAGESLPVWAKTNVYTKPKTLIAQNKAILEFESSGNDDSESVILANGATVELNRFYYPSREIKVDGAIVKARPSSTGLIEIDLAEGKHVVAVGPTRTRVERLADLISLLSLVSLVIYGFKKK